MKFRPDIYDIRKFELDENYTTNLNLKTSTLFAWFFASFFRAKIFLKRSQIYSLFRMSTCRFEIDSGGNSGPDALYITVSANKQKFLFEMLPGMLCYRQKTDFLRPDH